AGLGSILFLFLVSIVGTSLRESVLPAGQVVSRRRLWLSRLSMVITGIVLAGLLWLGNRWGAGEAAEDRKNRLYRPLETSATIRQQAGRTLLRLEVKDERFGRSGPLVPEHGKLVHLFLVREPKLDAFAHLHPAKVDWRTFEVSVPALPEGPY